MRVLIFDPFCGCAGDMILAALVSAGVDFESLQAELKKLHLENFELKQSKVIRHAINSVKIDVVSQPEHVHRHLKNIHEIIDASSLSEQVKTKAKKIFKRLAEAEARVHNSSPEEIHFHEVGAVDAIVDIVGACIGFELLGIRKLYTRPIGLGHGFVNAAHGRIPLPSPATAELVKDFPAIFHKVDYELSTPTGSAIITTLSEPVGDVNRFTVYSVGYGAGSHVIETMPNFLRVYIADEMTDLDQDQILKIETNIDDMNPEMFSYLFDGLLGMGAKDVYTTAINMKKNRPGVLLTVLCDPIDKDKLSGFIFANSTTSGMRLEMLDRLKLKREFETLDTSFGKLTVKVFYVEGNRRYYPEYEDLKRLASEHKISIIDLKRRLQIEINKIKEF